MVIDPAHVVTLETLRAAVHDAGLAAFKQPDRILRVQQIPLTAVGKPDRKAVAAQVREEQE